MKKKLLILIIIITIILLGIFGVYQFCLKDNKDIEPQEKIQELDTTKIVLKKDLTVPFLEERHVSDFIEKMDVELVDDFIIDSTSVGKQEVVFQYKDGSDIITSSFSVEVIDDVAPLAMVSNSYYVVKGGDDSFIDKIFCGDNADSHPKCTIEGDYDLTQEGTYPVTFKAVDASGNTYEKNTKIIVYTPRPKQDHDNKPVEVKNTYFHDIISTYKEKNTKIGIDVSKWQGDIDFDALKEAGVEFVIIRVGTSSGIGGEYVLDPKFIQNIENANRVGIDVGIYFFSYANTKEQALADALWVLEQIKDYSVTLPIAFDWEDWGDFNEYQVSFYELSEIANTFTRTIEKNGYHSMVYSSKYYLEAIWQNLDAPIWLAHYTDKTNYQGDYQMWQLCSNGKVKGIAGQVDIDVFYTKEDN